MILEEVTNPAFDATKAPQLTAIVPTFNRSEALSDLLESIAGQTLDAGCFEALAIDDGSCEEQARRVRELVVDGGWDFPLALCRQENAGPAAARNRMVRKARGDVVLFLNDDVTLDPGHFAAHLRLHRERPDKTFVVRGTTHWRPGGRDNSVMRYLRTKIFVYDLDLAPGDENFVYFHTCDLSLKKALLLEHPFDEDFPAASCEDTELGYRLFKETGMRLIVTPEAVSHHHHDYGPRDLIRRARLNGRSAAILIEKQPDLAHRLRDQFYHISRRRRILRALGHLTALRILQFWGEAELVVFLRNVDRESRRRSQRRGAPSRRA
jgi:GT2 family glycosyltransferase